MTDRRAEKGLRIEFAALLVAHVALIVFSLSWAVS